MKTLKELEEHYNIRSIARCANPDCPVDLVEVPHWGPLYYCPNPKCRFAMPSVTQIPRGGPIEEDMDIGDHPDHPLKPEWLGDEE